MPFAPGGASAGRGRETDGWFGSSRIFPSHGFVPMSVRVLVAAVALASMSAGLSGSGSASQSNTSTRRTGVSVAPLEYTVRIPSPSTHYVEVELLAPAAGRQDVELMMAVWTPGSYLVREFARNVEAVAAETAEGAALPLEKTRKNRWRVATTGAERVRVRYRVYAREMSVRTNFVEADFALLNGAATFMTLADGIARPHDIRLELPPAWERSVTALDPAPDGAPNYYRAPNFDALVDSPIVAGSPAVYEFSVDGVPHALVNVGEGGVWDGPRSARDVESIVRAQAGLWGPLPYKRYVFINLLTEMRGGLEHANSTVLMASRWATRTRRGYLDWLGLVSHELFHVWNVKRLRPIDLGPFDYEREVYTHDLWAVEGLTTYYGDLLVRRAGLVSEGEYLEQLSNDIESIQTTTARQVQPLSQASFDAWIKYYRPDENSPNVALSYYQKGGVVSFLLDAAIRRATNGSRTLDDFMRLAFERFSGERGFTSAEIRSLASEVAGTDLSEWLRRAIDTTAELDYRPALEWYGLRFTAEPSSHKAWLGVMTRVDNGRLLVSQVRRGTPAEAAGLNAEDEILAIGEYRVRPDQWESRLEAYRPGERVSILVARRERLVRLDAVFGSEPPRTWRLELDPTATLAQHARLREWLAVKEMPAGGQTG
jgi:predicted metalloprotease with PDZ domain